jgi:hypothetical protein
MASTDSTPSKICGKCGNSYPATSEYFYASKNRLSRDCRECVKADRRFRSANDPVYREAARQRNQKRYHDPDLRRKDAERVKARRSEINAARRERYRDDPEYRARVISRVNDNYQQNTDEIKERRNRASAERRKNDPDFVVSQREYQSAYNRRDDVRERRAKRHRERMQTDPNYRNRRTQNLRRYRSKPQSLIVQRNWQKRYLSTPKGRQIAKIAAIQRRARQAQLPDTFTREQWLAALQYFGHKCAACGQPEDFWCRLAPDHWIPLTDPRPDNPGTVATNIVPLCHAKGASGRSCNNSKSNKDPEIWLKEKFGVRKAREISRRIHAYFDSLNVDTGKITRRGK